LTHLVNSVTEKSLILYDEPETYLHPPLISAYLRAISWLLIDRNAIGILTTHSPIILQEVPKSCVWKIIRRGDVFNALRLENETFGENISLLNHEVFNLTASNSSFIDLLEYEAKKYIKENKNSDNIKIFKKVLSNFNNEIGSEARAHLMKIIKNIKMDVENEKN
ncbi:YjbD family protein, partial [Acinetobacter baumannii]|nr:YjbD family protein [Acinetobacter baumannii]